MLDVVVWLLDPLQQICRQLPAALKVRVGHGCDIAVQIPWSRRIITRCGSSYHGPIHCALSLVSLPPLSSLLNKDRQRAALHLACCLQVFMTLLHCDSEQKMTQCPASKDLKYCTLCCTLTATSTGKELSQCAIVATSVFWLPADLQLLNHRSITSQRVIVITGAMSSPMKLTE